MKKIFGIILFLVLFIPTFVFAKEKEINMYLFYGEECPHCHALLEFLDPYIKENPNVKLYKYEVWHNEKNGKLYSEVHELLKDNSNSIPYLIIGNTILSGFNEEKTPDTIKNAINFYKHVEYRDKVGIYLGLVEDNNSEEIEYKEEEIDIPIIGKKNIKDVSIILATIVIGLVDGFNPCAMCFLIFLISMLLGLKDKKR